MIFRVSGICSPFAWLWQGCPPDVYGEPVSFLDYYRELSSLGPLAVTCSSSCHFKTKSVRVAPRRLFPSSAESVQFFWNGWAQSMTSVVKLKIYSDLQKQICLNAHATFRANSTNAEAQKGIIEISKILKQEQIMRL